MRFKTFAKGRHKHKPGEMNAQEREYAARLDMRKRVGEIELFMFEAVTLKLAPDTRYTPDFGVMLTDGTFEFHEVKGHMEDDAWVKIKVAAAMFPFRFVLARKRPKKHGGGWEITVVGEVADTANAA